VFAAFLALHKDAIDLTCGALFFLNEETVGAERVARFEKGFLKGLDKEKLFNHTFYGGNCGYRA
jgi:hypothetical protein